MLNCKIWKTLKLEALWQEQYFIERYEDLDAFQLLAEYVANSEEEALKKLYKELKQPWTKAARLAKQKKMMNKNGDKGKELSMYFSFWKNNSSGECSWYQRLFEWYHPTFTSDDSSTITLGDTHSQTGGKT